MLSIALSLTVRIIGLQIRECAAEMEKVEVQNEDPEVSCKRAKLEDGFCSPAAVPMYLQQSYEAFHYYSSWYDSWARNVSAFRPWPAHALAKESKQ